LTELKGCSLGRQIGITEKHGFIHSCICVIDQKVSDHCRVEVAKPCRGNRVHRNLHCSCSSFSRPQRQASRIVALALWSLQSHPPRLGRNSEPVRPHGYVST